MILNSIEDFYLAGEKIFSEKELEFNFGHISVSDFGCQLPNVETIIFGKEVTSIPRFPAKNFPNLKRIVSNSRFVKPDPEGKVLIVHGTADVLVAVFANASNNVIDLKGVGHIQPLAFESCINTKIINADDIWFCYRDAFKDSCFENDFVVGGKILNYINENMKVLRIPRGVVAFVNNIDLKNVKDIVVRNQPSLDFIITRIRKNPVRNLIIDFEIKDISCFLDNDLFCEHVEIRNNESECFTEDGVIYIKNYDYKTGTDRISLLKVPVNRTRAVKVMDETYRIEAYAFEKSNVDSVEIADSVESICDSAFIKSGIKKCKFGSSIQRIDANAFAGCCNLEKIVFPNSLIYIGDSAFQDCTALKNVEFNNGLDTISEMAFYNTDIKEVSIPRSVTWLDSEAFYPSVEKIKVKKFEKFHVYSGCGDKYDTDILTGHKRSFQICAKNGFKITVPKILPASFHLSKWTEAEVFSACRDINSKIDAALDIFIEEGDKNMEDWLVKHLEDAASLFFEDMRYEDLRRLLNNVKMTKRRLEKILSVADRYECGDACIKAEILSKYEGFNKGKSFSL